MLLLLEQTRIVSSNLCLLQVIHCICLIRRALPVGSSPFRVLEDIFVGGALKGMIFPLVGDRSGLMC